MSTPEKHHVFTATELALKERYVTALAKIAELTAQRDALKEANASVSRQLGEAKAHAASLQNRLAEVQAEKSDALISAVEDLAASQREALDEIEAVAETNPARNEEDQITLNAIIELAQVATSSTPAPDRDFTAKSPSRQGEDGE